MVRDDVNSERVDRGETVSFRPGSFEPNALGDASPVKLGATKIVRWLKQLLVGLSFAAIVLFVCSSLTRNGEAAGSPPNILASVEAASFSAQQGKTKFDPAKPHQLR